MARSASDNAAVDLTSTKDIPVPDTESTANGADSGSSAQRERRKRILDATLALASKGGYDAVQMRTVAEKADVAVGTLYRYFPSKVHLLVTAMARELGRVEGRVDRSQLRGETAVDRLRHAAHRGHDPRLHVRRRLGLRRGRPGGRRHRPAVRRRDGRRR